MNKRHFITGGLSMAVLAVLGSGCTTTSGAGGDPAAQRQALNSQADNALARLYKEARDGEDLVKQARGVLVFPNFISAGFIIGGASGQGVLREGGKTVSYHRMTEGSVGLLAGAQSQAVFILFMTDDSLSRFKASNGWTVGADAGGDDADGGRRCASHGTHGAAAGGRLRADEQRADGQPQPQRQPHHAAEPQLASPAPSGVAPAAGRREP
jgi:lipid-binding SYLF domain-containing protein